MISECGCKRVSAGGWDRCWSFQARRPSFFYLALPRAVSSRRNNRSRITCPVCTRLSTPVHGPGQMKTGVVAATSYWQRRRLAEQDSDKLFRPVHQTASGPWLALSAGHFWSLASAAWHFTISEAGTGAPGLTIRGFRNAASLLLGPSKISPAGFPRLIARDSSCPAGCVKIVASSLGESFVNA